MSNAKLLSIVNGPSWSDAKDYALRILAEQGSLRDRMVFHLSKAHEATTAGVEGAPEYHMAHAYLAHQAGKFLREGANGSVSVARDAPRDVRQAWGILQAGGHGVDVGEVGRIGDAHIAEMVGAPAHVLGVEGG